MHTNLYLSFEYRPPRKNRWLYFARIADPGDDYVLCTLLGANEGSDEISSTECFVPRGWPEDASESALSEDCFTVDDDAAESDIGDILEDVRFCTRADAEDWIAAGYSRSLRNGYAVTDPEAYGQSWLSFEDFTSFVDSAMRYDSPNLLRLQAFQAAMQRLHESGCECRAIYWFN